MNFNEVDLSPSRGPKTEICQLLGLDHILIKTMEITHIKNPIHKDHMYSQQICTYHTATLQEIDYTSWWTYENHLFPVWGNILFDTTGLNRRISIILVLHCDRVHNGTYIEQTVMKFQDWRDTFVFSYCRRRLTMEI